MNKIKNKRPFEERLPLLLAFVLPMIVMVGVFAGKGIFPFGEKSFLRTDMYHQYAPFFMDFLRRLKTGRSLTYAWDIGLGSNYVALMAYYLVSPFQLFLLLLPEKYIIEFMTYLIVLKIGLSGFSMAYYLSAKFRTRSMGIAFFGICYALSGYMAAYSWNIMWLDCIWLAPLIILGLERLVREDRPFLYCVTLGLAIVTNYYISIMLCIFMVLYFICLLIMEKDLTAEGFLKKCGLFALFSVIGGALAAVLLIPAAYALMTTASANTSFPSTLTNYFSIIEMLSRHLVNVETEIGLDHWPNIYSGVAVFLFMPMYYMDKKIPSREKIVKTVLLFLMLVSFSFNIPNYIWHGFHYPNSLPARQSFLYTIILLSMCFEGFRNFRSMSRGKIVGIFWGVTAFILVCEKLVGTAEFHYNVYYVSLLFIALYALLLYLYRGGKIKEVTAYTLILAVLVLESGVNTAVTSVSITNRTSYWKDTESYQRMIGDIEDEEIFYRIEKYPNSVRRTKNDAAWIGYDSASIFSSTTHAGISAIYKKLGFEGNTNAYCFQGATPFTASLMSVKYLLTTSGLDESPLWSLADQEGGTYLYRNLYTLPLGFVIPSDTESLWSFTSTNPAKAQNSLANIIAGMGDVLKTIPGTTSETDYTTSVTERSHVFVFVENSAIDTVTGSSGDQTYNFTNVKRRYLLDLGYIEAGQSIRLSNTDEQTMNCTAYVFDDNLFMQIYDRLMGQAFDLTSISDKVTKTSLEGTVTATNASYVFMSIPYDKGWTVYVDDVVTEAEQFDDAFMMIPVTAGTHAIRMTYMPEGLKLGALISAAALALLLICALIGLLVRSNRRKKGELPGAVEDVVDIPEDEAPEEPGDEEAPADTAPPEEPAAGPGPEPAEELPEIPAEPAEAAGAEMSAEPYEAYEDYEDYYEDDEEAYEPVIPIEEVMKDTQIPANFDNDLSASADLPGADPGAAAPLLEGFRSGDERSDMELASAAGSGIDIILPEDDGFIDSSPDLDIKSMTGGVIEGAEAAAADKLTSEDHEALESILSELEK